MGRQATIADSVSIAGNGVHGGAPVTIVLHPADADTGIVFRRTGLDGGRERQIPAIQRLVGATDLCTTLGDPAWGSVATIEHLLAAVRGLGIDNILIEIDGPEVPIVDGSAAPFVKAIDRVGLRSQYAARRFIKVLKPVKVEQGRAVGELLPGGSGFRIELAIDFPCALIGRQEIALDVNPRSFRRELARARTFGFLKDLDKLLTAGFARGASLDNTVVIDGESVVNPEGLRWRNEFVRHKALDALGDLALAGAPILGTYRSFCGGHKLNSSVLKALLADPTAYAVVETVQPAVRARADLPIAAQPAFAAADRG